jgi:hypothetical protein
MSAGFDQFGSAIQLGPSMPIFASMELTSPTCGFNNQIKRIVPATVGTMDGRK